MAGFLDRIIDWTVKTLTGWRGGGGQSTPTARTKGLGEALMASTMYGGYWGGSGGSGGWGGWTQRRDVQVQTYRHFVYLAVRAVMRHSSKHLPNVAWVSHEDPSQHGKPRQPHATQHKWYSRKSSLEPLKPHEVIEPVPHNHPLYQLFEVPNRWDTGGFADLMSELVMFLELTGNAYLWTVPSEYGRQSGSNTPAELWVIPSHWVWPRYNNFGIDHYDIMPYMGRGAFRFPPEEVIAFRYTSPLHKTDGWSALTAGSEWIDAATSIDQSRFWAFKNGCFPLGSLELGEQYQDPDDADLERIYAKFFGRLQGETKYGTPLVLPPGAKYTPLTINPTEMAYGTSAEQMRDFVLALFGVPKELVGIQSAGSEIAMYGPLFQFATEVISPLLSYVGHVLTNQLARRFDRELRIWWDDPTPENPERLNQELQQDASLGMITPAEYRAARGRPPYSEEDEARYSKIGEKPQAPGGPGGLGGLPGMPPGLPGQGKDVGKGLDPAVVKTEERRDSAGHTYCVEPGKGRVACGSTGGSSTEQSSSESRGDGGEPPHIARISPKEPIVFAKPIVGPSGAKLLSYEWKYQPFEEYNERTGETEERRVSDWEQAERNIETGRGVVHHFLVETRDGDRHIVSLESALKMLGYVGKEGSSVRGLASSVKTLAKLRMELQINEARKETYDRAIAEARAKIDKLEQPKVERVPKPDERRVEWRMGDATVRTFTVTDTIPPETLRLLTSSWRDKRIAEIVPEDIRKLNAGGVLAERIQGLHSRLKKAQKKVDDSASIAASQEGKEPPTKSLKSCVPNRTGSGHHDSDTGHPCSAGSTAPAAVKPQSRPAKPATATSALLATVERVAATKESAHRLYRKLKVGALRGNHPADRRRLKTIARLSAAVLHKAEIGFTKAKEMVQAVTLERGYSPQTATNAARVVAVVDQVFAWTVNMPVATAATGSFTAGKIAAWIPVGSLAYIAFSTAANPLATWRAAKRVVRGDMAAAHKELAIDADAIVRLCDYLEGASDTDQALATVLVALDRTRGDLARALQLVEEPEDRIVEKFLDYWAVKGSPHADGEEWESNGRWYRREGGRTIRIPGRNQGQASKKPRGNIDAVHEQIQKARAKKTLTPDDAREVAASIMTLPMAEARALATKLFPQDTPKARDKAKLAQSLAERALATGREKAGNPEHEKAHAALTAILGDLHGLDLDDTEAVKAALKKVLADSKPPTEKPKEKPKSTDSAAVFDATREAYDDLLQNNRGGFVTVDDLVQRMEQSNPGMTTQQAHDLLRQWQREDKLTLQLTNNPDATGGIMTPRGRLAFLVMRPKPAPAEKKPAPQETTAHVERAAKDIEELSKLASTYQLEGPDRAEAIDAAERDMKRRLDDLGLESMNLADLKAVARKVGVGDGGLGKGDLIRAIRRQPQLILQTRIGEET